MNQQAGFLSGLLLNEQTVSWTKLVTLNPPFHIDVMLARRRAVVLQIDACADCYFWIITQNISLQLNALLPEINISLMTKGTIHPKVHLRPICYWLKATEVKMNQFQ